ncbi:MAG: biotin--[acetyl-CoA-carboxylase] ligase [Myxococcota bacterium]
MIHRVAITGSTNDDARALANAGAPHGDAVLADVQTAGRGRLGRTWVAPPGVNLTLSVVLRPRVAAARVPLVCLAAAVAVAEACGPGWAIKWPNDVVDGAGRKLAGILAEAEWDGGRPSYVIVGIGVNVAASPDGVGAVALVDHGPTPSRDVLAVEVVHRLVAWVDRLSDDGPAALLDAWRGRAATLGRRVQVGDVEGIAVDIDGEGALLVSGDDGVVRRVLAGDVAMIG